MHLVFPLCVPSWLDIHNSDFCLLTSAFRCFNLTAFWLFNHANWLDSTTVGNRIFFAWGKEGNKIKDYYTSGYKEYSGG
jgi:hypothetical protein